jgi:hypothetical protein
VSFGRSGIKTIETVDDDDERFQYTDDGYEEVQGRSKVVGPVKPAPVEYGWVSQDDLGALVQQLRNKLLEDLLGRPPLALWAVAEGKRDWLSLRLAHADEGERELGHPCLPAVPLGAGPKDRSLRLVTEFTPLG